MIAAAVPLTTFFFFGFDLLVFIVVAAAAAKSIQLFISRSLSFSSPTSFHHSSENNLSESSWEVDYQKILLPFFADILSKNPSHGWKMFQTKNIWNLSANLKFVYFVCWATDWNCIIVINWDNQIKIKHIQKYNFCSKL